MARSGVFLYNSCYQFKVYCYNLKMFYVITTGNRKQWRNKMISVNIWQNFIWENSKESWNKKNRIQTNLSKGKI